MLRSHLFIATLGALGLVGIGCGDSDDPDGNGGGNTGGGGTGGEATGVQPPDRPEANPGDGTGTVFGTSHIYIGTKTRAGAEANTAWEDFGYDLDGQVTSGTFTNHCKPAGGAAPNNTFPDGKEGRDNAFGKVLLPIIKTAASSQVSDLEAELNGAIEEGSFNIMLNIQDLGSAADYNPLDTLLLAGKEGDPATNTWMAAPEFLNDTSDPTSAKVTFPNSYLVGNTWVSGDEGTVDLNIAIAGFSLALKIRSAVITMDLDSAHGGASNGVIAGVLSTEELIAQLRAVIGNFDRSFCEGTAIEGILNQVRQASDIMQDGTQDPNAECDGISIGLGFDADVVTIGGVGTASQPAADLCLCGDGEDNPGEECDDGNVADGDGCSADCTVEE